jgi:hypothetical protein
MIKYRITKYNPKDRNEFGYYDSDYDDWTSFDDIGKDFKGKKLTLEEYLLYEDKYIIALEKIFIDLNIDELFIENIRLNSISKEFKEKFINIDLNEIDFNNKDIIESSITIDSCYLISRLSLRELIDCDIFHDKFLIHFGYDYYMYVFTSKKLSKSIKEIEDIGLYVEEIGKIPKTVLSREILCSLKNDNIVKERINVLFLSLNTLRNIFNLSKYNPINGVYSIDKNISYKLSRFVDLEFNFDKYNYSLYSSTYY